MSLLNQQSPAYVLLDQGRYEEALIQLLLHLADNSQDPVAWTAVGICYYNLQKITEAIENLKVAQRLAPDNPSTLISLAVCYSQMGMHDQATALADKAVALAPDHAQSWTNRAYIHSASSDDRAHIKKIYSEWGRRFADPVTREFKRKTSYKRTRGERLRVGFVSGDIRQHSILYFTMPFFQHYDRSRLEVFIYHTLPQDAYSEQVKALVDGWKNVQFLNDPQLYDTIRADQIDVLIDLSGHTTGARLNVFAMKPALVQMTWLGYMNTLGMRAIDYRITDGGIDPEGSEQFYVEKLLRVHCMAMYWPPSGPPLPDFLPMENTGHVTLVSPNHWRKLNATMLAVWNTILQRHPQARLLFICPDADTGQNAKFLSEHLHAYPALANQLMLMPRLNLEDFMSLAYVADLALDSYPISGGTTTLHALWMGLPVIALDSDHPTSGASAKTLQGSGLSECVARDTEHYIALVSNLIESPVRLRQLREEAHAAMQNSPLMDYPARVDELTTAMLSAWEAAATGQAAGVARL